MHSCCWLHLSWFKALWGEPIPSINCWWGGPKSICTVYDKSGQVGTGQSWKIYFLQTYQIIHKSTQLHQQECGWIITFIYHCEDIFAPSTASLSAASLPGTLECPFTWFHLEGRGITKYRVNLIIYRNDINQKVTIVCFHTLSEDPCSPA